MYLEEEDIQDGIGKGFEILQPLQDKSTLAYTAGQSQAALNAFCVHIKYVGAGLACHDADKNTNLW